MNRIVRIPKTQHECPHVPRRFQGGTASGAAHRRGSFTILALISLLVASMLGMSLVKMAVNHTRQIHREELRLQCDWLEYSGLQLAAAQLAADPDYSGEIWNVSSSELGGNSPARVQIDVEADTQIDNRRHVTVIAEYPVDATYRAKLSREHIIELPRNEPQTPRAEPTEEVEP